MESPTAPAAMSGIDLKLRRVAADIRTTELALAMGVTDSRVSYIEGRRIVTVRAAEKYLAALSSLTTKPTDTESVA